MQQKITLIDLRYTDSFVCATAYWSIVIRALVKVSTISALTDWEVGFCRRILAYIIQHTFGLYLSHRLAEHCTQLARLADSYYHSSSLTNCIRHFYLCDNFKACSAWSYSVFCKNKKRYMKPAVFNITFNIIWRPNLTMPWYWIFLMFSTVMDGLSRNSHVIGPWANCIDQQAIGLVISPIAVGCQKFKGHLCEMVHFGDDGICMRQHSRVLLRPKFHLSGYSSVG